MNMRKKPSKVLMLEREHTHNWSVSAHVLNTLSPHYYKHFRKWTISTSGNRIFSLLIILLIDLKFSNNQPILSEFGAQKERVEKTELLLNRITVQVIKETNAWF